MRSGEKWGKFPFLSSLGNNGGFQSWGVLNPKGTWNMSARNSWFLNKNFSFVPQRAAGASLVCLCDSALLNLLECFALWKIRINWASEIVTFKSLLLEDLSVCSLEYEVFFNYYFCVLEIHNRICLNKSYDMWEKHWSLDGWNNFILYGNKTVECVSRCFCYLYWTGGNAHTGLGCTFYFYF